MFFGEREGEISVVVGRIRVVIFMVERVRRM